QVRFPLVGLRREVVPGLRPDRGVLAPVPGERPDEEVVRHHPHIVERLVPDGPQREPLRVLVGLLVERLTVRPPERRVLVPDLVGRREPLALLPVRAQDRKSTRLNSSHVKISYAVFCLKKKKENGKNTNKKT